MKPEGAGSDSESEIEEEGEMQPNRPSDSRLTGRKRRRQSSAPSAAEDGVAAAVPTDAGGFLAPPEVPSSASSSTAQNSSAAASSAARGPGANDIIQLDDDMSYVRCVRTGHSQQLCRVERVEAGSGDVQVLGIVKRMIDARTASFTKIVIAGFLWAAIPIPIWICCFSGCQAVTRTVRLHTKMLPGL